MCVRERQKATAKWPFSLSQFTHFLKIASADTIALFKRLFQCIYTCSYIHVPFLLYWQKSLYSPAYTVALHVVNAEFMIQLAGLRHLTHFRNNSTFFGFHMDMSKNALLELAAKL